MAESPLANTITVGRILEAQPFDKARKEGMMKLTIDVGDEQIGSAAQLGLNYEPQELEGRLVLCVRDLGSVNIAGFESQALTVGVPDEEGNPVLVVPDQEVPPGGALY